MIHAFVSYGKVVKEVSPETAKKFIRDKKHNVWLNFEKPSGGEDAFLKTLGFHPLSIEDTLKGNQRPKIEDYEDYGYVVLRTLDAVDGGNSQLSIFLGKTFIVTYAFDLVPSLQKVMDNLKSRPQLLTKGHDFLAYSVFDAIVDDFFPILEQLDEEIDEVEEKLFSNPSPEIIERLFKLKRRVVEVRRVIWPMRDVLNVLSRRDYSYVNPKTAVYFRDVYDHLLRLVDMVDTLRELVTNAMEGYLSITSNNLNFIMKRLTAITVILMLPTLIASIYGMNVKIPFTIESHAFLEIAVVMVIVTIISFYYFKKKDWL